MSQKLQPVEGLAALRSDSPDTTVDALPIGLTPLNRQELAHFGMAGWQFVPANRGAEGMRHVYRDGAGHLVIEGRHLTIRLNPGTSQLDVPGILKEYNLNLRRPMGLKRDMLQVAPAEGSGVRPDLVELCHTIEKDERIAWAEPSLIESFSKR